MGNQPSVDAETVQGLTNALTELQAARHLLLLHHLCGPPGYWRPEQPPHEGWLRRCRFCGHQAYWSSGVCINEREVQSCLAAFNMLFFCPFCVSIFWSTKISYTAEKSGDLNRAKLWGGKEVPRDEYVHKVEEVRKRINKPKKVRAAWSKFIFLTQAGASSPCTVFN